MLIQTQQKKKKKRKGKKHSEEFCLKLRKPKTNTDNMKGPRNTKTCPHCNLTASSRNITVYHMDNCFMSPSNIPILTLDKNIHADACFTVAEISRLFNISAALISHLIKINKIQHVKDRSRYKIRYRDLYETITSL